jgi:hypothetical protein
MKYIWTLLTVFMISSVALSNYETDNLQYLYNQYSGQMLQSQLDYADFIYDVVNDSFNIYNAMLEEAYGLMSEASLIDAWSGTELENLANLILQEFLLEQGMFLEAEAYGMQEFANGAYYDALDFYSQFGM